MANLLPPSAKQAIRRASTARFVTLGSFALLAGAFIVLLALAPSYIVLKMQEAQSAAAVNDESKDDAAVKAELQRTQALVTQFASLASSTPIVETYRALLQDRPSGVHMEDMNYVRDPKTGKGMLTVSGVSSGREDINTFRVTLEKDAHFQNISVPVSALAGAQEGRFTITLSGAF